MGIAIDGLISGLDVTTLVERLLEVESTRVQQLQAKQTTYTDKITAYQNLNARLLALRTSASTLKKSSLFSGRTASSSDTDILTVSAASGAALGTNILTVQQLAKSSQFSSNSFADTDKTALGTGDIRINVGTGTSQFTKVVTIDSTDNTLAGIRDAINDTAGDYVSASIVTVDNSDRPYKLLISAKTSGSEGQLSIDLDATFKTTASGEAAGVGAGTATASTDDSNAKTYAFNNYPIDGTETVKIDGATIASDMAAPSNITLTAQSGGALEEKKTYYYRISAIDDSGETIASTEKSVHLDKAQKSVDISFDAVSGATAYRIYRTGETPGSYSGSSLVAETTLTTYTDNTPATSLSAGSPLDTSTQGYTVNYSTGAITFRSDQTGAVTLDYDYGLGFVETQEAQDAIIKFGSESSAFTVTKSSNSITDLIEGVTLNLVKADSTKPITFSVSASNSNVTGEVNGFIKNLNSVLEYIREVTLYDSDTGKTGLLFSDHAVQTVRSRLDSDLSNPVEGLTEGALYALSQAGITINASTGNYLLDDSKFSGKLTSVPDEVRDLFAATGRTDDSDIKFTGSTSKTKASGRGGYSVSITRAATRASREGQQDISGGLTMSESLTIVSAGKTATITLTSGMTATQVVSAINTGLVNAEVDAAAVYDSATGKVTVRHDSFGSDYSLSITSNRTESDAGSTGLGTTLPSQETTYTGQDVAGTINGEAAEGEGQLLKGKTGNTNTEGLILKVTITPESLASQGSAQGTVFFTRGVADRVDTLLEYLTDTNQNGPITSAVDLNEDRIDDVETAIETFLERSGRHRERLLSEFNKLELALGQLQTTSSFLSQQMDQIQANARWIGAPRK